MGKTQCCPHKDVIDIVVDFLSTAQLHNITIFPRNGFLLGIVRHGGFLPQELDHVDADLGVMDSKELRSIERLHGQHAFYDLRVRDTWPVYWLSWMPWLWRAPYTVPYQVDITSSSGHKMEANFFHKVGDKVIYPLISSINNLASNLRENEAWGSNLKGHWGGYFIEFDGKDYETFSRLPFYTQHIRVPAGYKRILRCFYGPKWTLPEARDSRGVSQAIAPLNFPLAPCDINIRSDGAII